MTDADVLMGLSPAQIVALTLYGEGRGSSPALRAAIASVILNRSRARGQDPAAVCLAPRQFSCWKPAGGEANYAAVMKAGRALLDGGVIGPILKGCLALADRVLSGELEDTVHSATHYYSPAAMVPRDRVPSWAVGLEPVAIIDSTRFYEGVK